MLMQHLAMSSDGAVILSESMRVREFLRELASVASPCRDYSSFFGENFLRDSVLSVRA